MKTKKLKGLQIEVPKGDAFKIETPLGLPKMHFIMMAVAKRGAGKTTSIVTLLKKLQQGKCLDRLFIISPTMSSNKALMDMLEYEEDDMYDTPGKDALDDIIEKIKQEADDYEEYHEKMKAYKKYLKYLENGRNMLSDDDILLLFDGDEIQVPTHRWNGRRPTMLILFDDCQNSPLFMPRSNLTHLAIKHRHMGQLKTEGGALGVSLVFACQSYKSMGGGLPRAVRNQATHLMVFKSKDAKELDEIADEVGGEVTKDTFIKVYEHATDEPHSFLYIDFHKKDTDPSMFRKKFDEYIMLD